MADDSIDKKEPKDDNLSIGARGGTIAFVMRVLTAVFGFTNQIVLARILGAGGLGEILLALSIVSISSQFAKFGMEGTVMRFIPLYIEKRDGGKLKGTILYTLKFCFLLSIVFVGTVLLFSRYISIDFFHSEGLLKLMPIVVVAIPASVLRGVISGIFKGYKDAFKALLPEFLILPSRVVIFICLFFIWEVSPVDAIIAFASGEILAVLLAIIFLVKKIIAIGDVHQEYEREKVFGLATTMVFTNSSALLYNQANLWIIGMFMSTEAVGVFGVALRLVNLVIFSLRAFSTILPPIMSSIYASDDRNELRRVVSESTRWILSISMPIILILIFEGKLILEYAFGEGFEDAYIVLVILTAGQLINAGSGLVGLLLQMTGRHKIQLKLTLFWGVISIALSFILVPLFGITGAAIAIASCLAMTNITAVFIAYKRLSIVTLARGVIFDIVFIAVITGLYFFLSYNDLYWGNHIVLAFALIIYIWKSIVNGDLPDSLSLSRETNINKSLSNSKGING